MKIVLVGINARFTHSNLALRYLREMTSDLPQNTVIREFTINMPVLEIAQGILTENPDIAAFSVYIWNAELAAKLIALLKLLRPSMTVVAGGPEAGFRADDWLAHSPGTDIVITGAGEAAFRELAQKGFPRSERVVKRDNPPFADIPFPYKSGFDGLENRYLYYESSRGCPFSCSYCLSSRGDQRLEFRPVETVLAELDILIEQKPQLVKFVDRSFNADRPRAMEIWRYLIQKAPDTKFHCEIHPLLIGDEELELLAAAPEGLFQFEAGVQSTNYRTLGEIGRPVPWDKIRGRLEKLIALKNIHTHLDLVIGLPYDDLVTIKEAFDNVLSLSPDHFQMGFLKALHGTSLRQHADDFGLIFEPFPPYEIVRNSWLSEENLCLLRRIEQLVETLVNSRQFSTKMNSLADASGGWFSLMEKLSEYCGQISFDIQTKNRQKLDFLLERFSGANSIV